MVSSHPANATTRDEVTGLQNPAKHARQSLIAAALFAVAMAWVESACVAYLRTLLHRVDPYQISPLPAVQILGTTEIVREAATLVMLASVGWLSGRGWRSRFGCFLLAFGVWDIFYYVFLRVIVGWPRTLFDWDILFLIPLPWWGPVLAPMLVSAVLIVIGALLTFGDDGTNSRLARKESWVIHWFGIFVILFLFMSDSLGSLSRRGDVRSLLPTAFPWPIFVIGLLCMCAPIVDFLLSLRFVKSAREGTIEP